MKLHDEILKTITDDVERAIAEGGQVCWEKPWNGTANMPRSAQTGKAYQGINTFLLSILPYASPYFLTYRQAKKLGGSVMRGETGHRIYFYKFLTTETKDKETGKTLKKGFPLLKSFVVFNASQCDLPEEVQTKFAPVEGEATNPEDGWLEADAALLSFIEREGIALTSDEGGLLANRACYSHAEDRVNMPKRESFSGDCEYVSTLAHECVHATGHESRLQRRDLMEIRSFGSEDYSREELVAEMGAGIFCAIHDIDRPVLQRNRTAYLRGWLRSLKNDPKMLMWAGSRASKAVDWIHNIKPGEVTD
mgnify:CR=1 FL=1